MTGLGSVVDERSRFRCFHRAFISVTIRHEVASRRYEVALQRGISLGIARIETGIDVEGNISSSLRY